MKVGRQILMSIYVRPDQKSALARLAKVTDLSQQALLREALDDLIAKHAAVSVHSPVDSPLADRPKRARRSAKRRTV